MDVSNIEEMSDEDRAVWIGERLLRLKPHPEGGYIRENANIHSKYFLNAFQFREWLESLMGIHFTKLSMIEREYNINIQIIHNMPTTCTISTYDNQFWSDQGKTEVEAVLNAVYKALAGEVK